MNSETEHLRQFGNFRLDTQKKILWHNGESVPMPLKELEVLCVLVENRGELVTKDVLLEKVWADSFVEESNLTRHIYLLRKTLRDLGAEEDLIKNIPRRGYRFKADVRELKGGDIVLERRTQTRTLIEIQEGSRGTEELETENKDSRFTVSRNLRFAAFTILLFASVGIAAFFGYQLVQSKPAGPGIRSIAVLPFKSIGERSGNSQQGLGLADVLITRLSNVKGLNVRSTSAVLDLEGQDPASVGEKLKVDAVLEGTIYHGDDKIRVTARLVKTNDNSTIWTGEFEKLLQDELRLQNEISLQIVETLALNLTGNEKNALAKRYTESADAYHLYVKARYEWNKRSHSGMIEAQRLFRNAIERDPNFALAYVGLADTLATSRNSTEATIVIEKALEIDPNLAEAHASLGFLKLFHSRKWTEAEKAFKRSIELNRNYATAHHWYATLLAIKGETEAAKAEMRRALEINPLSYNFLADLGQLHYFAGEYEEAKEYCNKALEIYPDFIFAHQYLHYIYLKTGEYDLAIEELIKTERINNSFSNASVKEKERLEAGLDGYRQGGIIGNMERRFPGAPQDPDSFYFYAIKHSFLGENDKAVEYLEKASAAGTFMSVFVKAEPIFNNLRDEPRYQEILRKMDLAE